MENGRIPCEPLMKSWFPVGGAQAVATARSAALAPIARRAAIGFLLIRPALLTVILFMIFPLLSRCGLGHHSTKGIQEVEVGRLTRLEAGFAKRLAGSDLIPMFRQTAITKVVHGCLVRAGAVLVGGSSTGCPNGAHGCSSQDRIRTAKSDLEGCPTSSQGHGCVEMRIRSHRQNVCMPSVPVMSSSAPGDRVQPIAVTSRAALAAATRSARSGFLVVGLKFLTAILFMIFPLLWPVWLQGHNIKIQ